jgi:diguanylate cyclase (GGDEF)-like protein
VTLALIPISGHHLAATTTYLPAILAVVTAFDVLSMWLLTGEYKDSGDRRLLVMGSAYLWSLILMGGYALAFPGVFSSDPPLAVTVSVAPYLYVGWHAGFPVLLGLAWSPSRLLSVVDEPRRRSMVAGLATVCAVAVALGTIICLVGFAKHLPVLIHGRNTSAMTRVTAPVVLPLVLASLAVCARGVRGRSGPERWTHVAITVCLCDLLLTYVSHYRFSLGWYAGRTMTVTAAAIVLVAMLSSFRRLKAQAQYDADHDSLTGLPNRRSTYSSLEAMVVLAQRTRTPLAVVMFDLDHFKAVNDTHGHSGGDAVLLSVADTLRADIRAGDRIGRVGGEEFLLLMPGATDEDVLDTVQQLRIALRTNEIPILGTGVTASFGISTLQDGDDTADAMMSRADRAMYDAKESGRDRIAVADLNEIHA